MMILSDLNYVHHLGIRSAAIVRYDRLCTIVCCGAVSGGHRSFPVSRAFSYIVTPRFIIIIIVVVAVLIMTSHELFTVAITVAVIIAA